MVQLLPRYAFGNPLETSIMRTQIVTNDLDIIRIEHGATARGSVAITADPNL